MLNNKFKIKMKYIKNAKVIIWVPEKQRMYKVNNLIVIIIIY